MVWSSVLGHAVTKLVPDGNKWQTAITAGGTTIATDDVQTGILKWKASDPVTGSTATFSYDSSGSGRSVKEYEPLGQEVSIEDPAELPDPPPNESVSHWIDMEWQCMIQREYFNSFGSMPFHCQMQDLMSLDHGLSDIYGWYREMPGEKQHKKRAHIIIHHRPSASDKILDKGLRISAKPVGETGGQGEPGSPCTAPDAKGKQKPGRYNKDGKCEWQVDVERPSIDMGDIPGTDVRVSGWDDGPCAYMAAWIDNYLESYSQLFDSVSIGHSTLDSITQGLGENFSTFYAGGPIRNIVEAERLSNNTNGIVSNRQSKSVPGWLGQQDFKTIFQDPVGRTNSGRLTGPLVDQTHHFAVFFAAGIHNTLFAAKIDSFIETDPGDVELNPIAFGLGFSLRNQSSYSRKEGIVTKVDDPRDRARRIRGIASRIRILICK